MTPEIKTKIVSPLRGRPKTLDHRLKAGRASGLTRKIEGTFRGEANPAWKDGRMANPQYVSWIKNRRNRTVRAGLEMHTFEEWTSLIVTYKETCPSCFRKQPEVKLTIDHIQPLSLGGSDLIENIQPLCQSCNSRKSAGFIHYPVPT